MFAFESKLQVTRYKFITIFINDNQVNQFTQRRAERYAPVIITWAEISAEVFWDTTNDRFKQAGRSISVHEHTRDQERQVYFELATATYKMIRVSPAWTIGLPTFKFQNRFFNVSIADSLSQIIYIYIALTICFESIWYFRFTLDMLLFYPYL